jgi:hypothetical protein
MLYHLVEMMDISMIKHLYSQPDILIQPSDVPLGHPVLIWFVEYL